MSTTTNTLFEKLSEVFGEQLTAQAKAAARDMHRRLPASGSRPPRILVAFGGGKDSSFTLGFARLLQLQYRRLYGRTLQLRVVTNRHAGMPAAVAGNIHRAYLALGLYSDAEVLVVDGDEVRPFTPDLPLPPHVVERNRADILMSGHRTQGDPRSTFCMACNLSMLNGFAWGAIWNGGVDLIVTGDSPEEVAAYRRWTLSAARRMEKGAEVGHPLDVVRRISDYYYGDLHGAKVDALPGRRFPALDPGRTSFFSIYEHTRYEVDAHWQVLDSLGFEFDDVTFAFSFTESDCSNPTLMCHLRGLKQERIFDRSYDDGVDEYLEFALRLMETKSFPPHLIEQIRARYSTPEHRAEMRCRAARAAEATFGLGEEQWVAMLYSPFAGEAGRLRHYLERERPELLGEHDAIRRALARPEGPVPAALRRLSEISGLSLEQMRYLHGQPLLASPVWLRDRGRAVEESRSQSPLAVIRQGDPHRGAVATRHAPDGPELMEVLSGR